LTRRAAVQGRRVFGCNSGGRKEGSKEENGGEELSWREGERGRIFFATTTAV